MKRVLLAALAAAAFASSAHGEVTEKGPNGFRLRYAAQVAAPPEAVFMAIGEPAHWWSGAHTYSGQAANLTLPLTAEGCFCEALPDGGGVRHGVVQLVTPSRLVRLDAALGPLQDEGVSGAWAFNLRPKDGGTELVMTYNVGGARNFVTSLAPAVDGVMGEAFSRLTRYVESRPSATGKPR